MDNEISEHSMSNLDVDSSEAKRILHERAEILAEVTEEEDLNKYAKYLKFQLGTEEQYGIPYHYLKEILRSRNVTPVPESPDCVSGVINWRSKILSVLDLRKIFNIKSDSKVEEPWLLVVKNKEMTMGLLADDVVGDELYEIDGLTDPAPLSTEMNSKYVLGIYQGKVVMLNMDVVLNDNIVNKV